ncbi:DeoR family transcriptional regulator [Rhodobacteraceae bacterium 2CG4]|uniref:DeoR family transcriptional regulator n=1 Tax=Halovulum marinum TaxID=2662447 RepID=A0A6L5Z0R8_9RHOB|nr:DeoR/GlpR family DNA-binding transcription regulator [Halovulum marinum]MSU90131.1 DeoR family transcriptional regulator [Halovulum marinum]
MDLNIPETRQAALARRLAGGHALGAAELAAEFGVSVDTVRRDIIALERAGRARRVRGGAVPVARAAGPVQQRLGADPDLARIAAAALPRLKDCRTLLLDGGASVQAVAERLPQRPDLLVITPSPFVAIACQRRGIAVHMLGGRLSPRGGVNTGQDALAEAGDIAAEIAVLGACGLEPGFGLSSDDPGESRLKRAMAGAAAQVMVVTAAAKLGRRARHRTLPAGAIDLLVTDADAAAAASLAAAGIEVIHA